MNKFKPYLVYPILVLFSLLACENVGEKATENTVDKGLISEYLTDGEIKSFLEIKSVFDKAICFEGKIKQISDCYLSHAQAYGYDAVKQVEQINKNYPYHTDFDLTQMKSSADSLNFLTLNCGFQNEKTGAIVNFYCLKNEGGFMDYLEALGESNSVIKEYHKEYSTYKQVSNDFKKRASFLLQHELDLEQFDHQIFYMFYHLMINEEVQAQKKIRKSS